MRRKRRTPALLAIEPVHSYRQFLQAFSEQANLPIIYASSFTEGIAAIDRGWYCLAITELSTAPMSENPGDLGAFVETLRLAHDEHVPIIGWTNLAHHPATEIARRYSLDVLLRKGGPTSGRDKQILHSMMQQLVDHPLDYKFRPYLKPYRVGGSAAFRQLE